MYTRYKQEVVTKAVHFILNLKNVTTVSWTDLNLVLMQGGVAKQVVIPGLLRKKNISSLYQNYFEENHETGTETVGATLFRRIADKITENDQQQRQSVWFTISRLN